MPHAKQRLEVGLYDVVQIDPNRPGCYQGCYLTVQRVTDQGVTGYIQLPAPDIKGFPEESLRKEVFLPHGAFRIVGRAHWI